MKFWQFLVLSLVCTAVQYLLPQLWQPFMYLDFFLLLVFHTGRVSRTVPAIWRGFLAGLLQDLTLSGLYPVGLQAATKMIVGLLARWVGQRMNVDHLGLQSLIVFSLACLNNGLILFLFSIFGQTCPVQSYLPLLFGAACTALVNFPVWMATARSPQEVVP